MFDLEERTMRVRRHAAVWPAIFLALYPYFSMPASAREASGVADLSVHDTAPRAKHLDIRPRLQWRENFGYCGEISMISAGLYFGQYISQYDARAIASRSTPQYKRGSQLLLGVNDSYAGAQMHLKTVEWHGGENSDTNSFLLWIKRNIALDFPVLIGIYTNHYYFDGSSDAGLGDPEYDHIVPVIGVESKVSLASASAYSGDDVVLFSDNGIWPPTGKPAYLFSYSFREFQKSRAQANAPSAGLYSLAKAGANFGIAITGVIDEDHETVPVRVSVSRSDEQPDIAEGSDLRPRAIPLTLTVKVSGIEPGVNYRLYRYNRMESVPDRAFNAHAQQAVRQWEIDIASGSSAVITERIWSNEIAVYRAVRADAR
ncbi:hypothetical protein [Burkholderia gladioli]|uniref:hypothetical protein n=1 Tax=Burkholderia gladioli TaxID=28095 RepID=UPI001ABAFF36|nr:hypothetical protein [Burkholderia gladioli]